MKKNLWITTTIFALAFSMCACGSSKNDLTVQASVSEETGTLTFDLPEGFSSAGEDYYRPEEASHGSNINLLVTENDGSFDMLDAEVLVESAQSQLEAIYGTDVPMTILEESSYEVSGYRVFRYSFECELSGHKTVQLQCVVESPEHYYYVTYLDYNNEGYSDVFKASADTLRFE